MSSSKSGNSMSNIIRQANPQASTNSNGPQIPSRWAGGSDGGAWGDTQSADNNWPQRKGGSYRKVSHRDMVKHTSEKKLTQEQRLQEEKEQQQELDDIFYEEQRQQKYWNDKMWSDKQAADKQWAIEQEANKNNN